MQITRNSDKAESLQEKVTHQERKLGYKTIREDVETLKEFAQSATGLGTNEQQQYKRYSK